ncbi:MAG: hypothetical protein MZV49_08125 [Rhodopseudomonas palustris]|nr:hypothetical protein [Rhodopseudomonas palustris]
MLSVAVGGAANGSDRERDLEVANGATAARASGRDHRPRRGQLPGRRRSRSAA